MVAQVQTDEADRSRQTTTDASQRQMDEAHRSRQTTTDASQQQIDEAGRGRQATVDAPQKQIDVPEQDSATQVALQWPRRKFVPLLAEQSIVKVMLRHKKERGMMRAQPADRVREVRDACSRLDVTFEQALSIRRHHVRNNCKAPNQEQVVQLGTEVQIREAADLFEEAIAAHLASAGVAYLTEAAQRARNGDQPRPTPDFLLPSPVTIQQPEALAASWTHEWRRDASDGGMYTQADFNQYYAADGDAMWAAAQPRAPHLGGPLHWIEVKHYYGPSTIPMNGKSAAGKLFAVVDKYVRLFGPGALVLCEGCGEALAAELEARGALVLDSLPLDLSLVQQQMSTWCAGPGGELLP